MSNLFQAIRMAVLPGVNADALAAELEGETGAQALNPEIAPAAALAKGANMSGTQTVAGAVAAVAGVIPTASPSIANSGETSNAAMDRIGAILSAEGIKGDAGRMSAGLDLARSAPGMSADAVVAFVTANVSAAGASTNATAQAQPAAAQPAASYEQQRVAAAALAMPSGVASAAASGPMINRDAIFAARRNQQKGA